MFLGWTRMRPQMTLKNPIGKRFVWAPHPQDMPLHALSSCSSGVGTSFLLEDSAGGWWCCCCLSAGVTRSSQLAAATLTIS